MWYLLFDASTFRSGIIHEFKTVDKQEQTGLTQPSLNVYIFSEFKPVVPRTADAPVALLQ